MQLQPRTSSLLHRDRCPAPASTPGQLHLNITASGRHRAARRQSGCCCSTSDRSSDAQQAAQPSDLSRRHLLLAGSAGTLTAASVPSAGAMQLPGIFNEAWKGLGGGPADLFFPDSFSGRWIVDATLTNVKMPLGSKFVPDIQSLSRAVKDDLEKPVQYEVNFIRNQQGHVITDRRFNTASLMALYLGKDAISVNRVDWNPDDPNVLSIRLPGGTDVRTRVTRRSQDNNLADERLDTSEFFEQIFDLPERVEPKVKASQCFTKYKWRTTEEAAIDNGPEIVATQVVSDYLTPYDGEMLMMQAKDRPVVVFTYRMTFRRPSLDPGPQQA